MKQLLYYTVKIFFHSILSIFFREVNIIGSQNIPRYGPVIFTSNHANQFMDSVVVLSTCERTISFLMAEVSYVKRIVGDIAWAMGVVPVKRAMDSAVHGLGLITIEEMVVNDDHDVVVVDRAGEETNKSIGSSSQSNSNSNSASAGSKQYIIHGHENTQFTKQIKPKDTIQFQNCLTGLKVLSIQSDTKMIAVDNNHATPSSSSNNTNEKDDANNNNNNSDNKKFQK